MIRTVSVLAALALALGATACGDDTGEGDGSAAAAAVTVSGQWARTSPMVAGSGAAYMTLTAAEDDTLVGASVDAGVAAGVELHETVMEGGMEGGMGDGMADDTGGMDMGDDMTSTTMAGMGEMSMQPVEEIALPAGEQVELAPGGLHIMLIDLAEPLVLGSEIEITLDFARGDDQVVKVPVLDEAP